MSENNKEEIENSGDISIQEEEEVEVVAKPITIKELEEEEEELNKDSVVISNSIPLVSFNNFTFKL